ncbi:MAG TPA: type II secretion system minor pseudopilin GspK [Myxococcales bacterium]|nr:type II secretion system minor pseudopilin GspK [Myxococcales bacterium]
MRSAPLPQRGVALILVLVTIAILTSIGVDFSYGSRVSLKLAENLRDETRAEYLARSAINLSRLLLHFQKQVDQLGGQVGAMLSKAIGAPAQPAPAPAPATGTPAQAISAAPAANNLGIRLWQVLPIDSNAFGALLAGNIAGLDQAQAEASTLPPPPAERRAVRHSFGGFDGSFHARIVDENSRINVQALDNVGNTPQAVFTQLRAMMADPKYDFIFDEEDANRDRVRRDDVILAMKDWIDIDETSTALDPTNPQRPFANGFGDENSAYSRYEPPYVAKNGRFDSLEELYMVRGVNDRYMAAFGDRLTIWPDINSRLNINTDDPQQMLTNILIAAANPNDPTLRDPRLLQTILQEIQVRKMFSFFGMSAQDFVAILQANGIRLRPEIDARQGGNPGNLFGSTSDTFRITATGRVGRVEKELTAVVRYDDALGKLLYWKED